MEVLDMLKNKIVWVAYYIDHRCWFNKAKCEV